jgi:hypothetical protein
MFQYVNNDINKKIISDWKASPLFKRREKIIKDAFLAHEHKIFTASITTFLTQLDHVILQIAKLLKIDHGRRITKDKILKDLCDFIDNLIM